MDEKSTGKFRIEVGRPLLALVCLVVFIDSVGYGVVVPVLPIYAKQLNASDFQIGFLFATYAIALLLAAIPMGMLSDRIGRKPFVLFGMFAMSGAFIFYAHGNSYWVLVVARVLDGLTASATWSAGLALVSDRFGKEVIGAKLGYAMSAAALGAIAGPLIGGVLSDTLGHRAPFYAIAVLCFAGGIAAYFLSEDRAILPQRRAFYADMLKPVITNKVIMLACTLETVTTLGFGLLEPMLPLHLAAVFGLSSTGIGLVFGMTMLTFAGASPLSGKLSDAVGRKRPIMAGLLATAALVPFLAITRNLAVVYILMGAVGITLAASATPSMSLVTDALRPLDTGGGSLYGTAFGLTNLFWSLGYAIGPLLGGALVESAGLLMAVYVYSALLVLLAVLVFKLLGKSDARERGATG